MGSTRALVCSIRCKMLFSTKVGILCWLDHMTFLVMSGFLTKSYSFRSWKTFQVIIFFKFLFIYFFQWNNRSTFLSFLMKPHPLLHLNTILVQSENFLLCFRVCMLMFWKTTVNSTANTPGWFSIMSFTCFPSSRSVY